MADGDAAQRRGANKKGPTGNTRGAPVRFAEFNYINLLWGFFGLLFFFFVVMRRRKRILTQFADRQTLAELVSGLDTQRRNIKYLLFFIALFLCCISLMRPQWGFSWQELKRRGLDIFIAIDSSKSMLSEDIKPNRLKRAKLAVQELVRKLPGDRIGLIAFSGTAFIQCPLTVDYSGFLLSLESVNTDTIPAGGTSISGAIREAIRGYEGGINKYKILIIISDGEDHEGDALKAAEEAKKEGINIFCIGAGTPEGELIPVNDQTGAKGYLKDLEGNVVKSRLNESILQKIALSCAGIYVRANTREFGLNLIYDERLSKMEKQEFEGKMHKQYNERYQIPLWIALILLAAELIISEKKRG